MNERAKNPTMNPRIALIQACWHKDFVDRCRDSFIEEMLRLGYLEDSIDVYAVPGSLEIPLQAKVLAKSGAYAAIAAAGFVVNGGIYRHDFVASTVIDALMQVQLETEVPVLSAVLTPHSFHETDEHKHFFLEHLGRKGKELAAACTTTIRNLADARKAHKQMQGANERAASSLAAQ